MDKNILIDKLNIELTVLYGKIARLLGQMQRIRKAEGTNSVHADLMNEQHHAMTEYARLLVLRIDLLQQEVSEGNNVQYDEQEVIDEDEVTE